MGKGGETKRAKKRYTSTQDASNLGLESFVARADGAFRVIAHSVSAALA